MAINEALATALADFLKKFPPFNWLLPAELAQLVLRAKVQYHTKDKIIYQQGAKPEPHFYVVHAGLVGLEKKIGTHNTQTDYCETGDLFGIRPHLAGNNYWVTAKMLEAGLLYEIPFNEFSALIAQNAKIALYFAAGYAAGIRPSERNAALGAEAFRVLNAETSNTLTSMQRINGSQNPIAVQTEVNIRQAARLMHEKQIGSLLVLNGNALPMGIITDKDLRKWLALGNGDFEKPVTEIMSTPVLTAPPDQTAAYLLSKMVANGVHHLVITQDGTAHSAVIGVVSNHDLSLANTNSPEVLLREMKKASSLAALAILRKRLNQQIATWLDADLPINQITQLVTGLNDELLKAIMRLHVKEQPSGLAFEWLALGSAGRGEQLLQTDQDHAIMLANAHYSTGDYRQIRDWCALIAHDLAVCGFEHCPGDTMSHHPNWSRTLSDWKNELRKWVQVGDRQSLLNACVFFDYRTQIGHIGLGSELADYLFALLDKSPLFLSRMAQFAVGAPPPTGIFKNMILERSGDHKQSFDLKLRSLAPFIDYARILTLQHKIKHVNNTIARFEAIALIEPQQASLYNDAAHAFELLLRLRFKTALKEGLGGRYLPIDSLNKIEKEGLYTVFQIQDSLEKLIKVRFRVNLLGI